MKRRLGMDLNRRDFLRKSGQVAAMALAGTTGTACAPRRERPNILLITADDMSYDSLGLAGCEMPRITPHIDHFASQGAYFSRAHVNVSQCQPSRSVLMTGLFPHRNGAMSEDPILPGVTTLGEQLCEAGYTNAIFCKSYHLTPPERFCWHRRVQAREVGHGRDPEAFHRQATEFFADMQRERTPFFLMLNSLDPHRPFKGPFPRRYSPLDAHVPAFMADLQPVREELARYYSAVHRLDRTVGAVLRALDEAGLAENTLVAFLSDNSMSFPFSKANCYPHSTLVPWVLRFPGRIREGMVESERLISGVDLMPTLLEAVGLEPPEGLDGRSLWPLLRGEQQARRDRVYTYLFTTKLSRTPMRAVVTRDHAYIFNPWSDGRTEYQSASFHSFSFRAMRKAAETDPALAARVRFYSLRAPEELYARASDPFSLKDLAKSTEHAAALAALRDDLAAHLQRSGDPVLPDLERYLDAQST